MFARTAGTIRAQGASVLRRRGRLDELEDELIGAALYACVEDFLFMRVVVVLQSFTLALEDETGSLDLGLRADPESC